MIATTVVFDLDGTLIDTAPDLIHATNHVLVTAGHAAVPGEELRPFISFGSRRMIERGLELNGRSLPPGEVDKMFAGLLDYYAENIAVDSAPYPELTRVLDGLLARGARLAVCTNKMEWHSHKLLAALDLANRFAAICGRDTFPVCKPHPAHLIGAIARAGGDTRRAVMVGDSATDVTTARAAGIPIVGVSFGYSDVAMRELGPDALIHHYGELDTALIKILDRVEPPQA